MKKTRLFIYGTLKKGFVLNRHIANQKFIGEATTCPEYTLLDLGWFPGLVEGSRSISGEVWEVDDKGIVLLDRVEGGAFARKPIKLLPPYDKENVEAYFYIDSRRGCPIYSGPSWSKCL